MASSLSCWLTSSPLTLASETLSGLPLAHFRVVSLFLRPSEALFFLVNPGSSPATTNVGRIYLRHSSNPHSMCITYTLSIYIYIHISIYLSICIYIYVCVCMYVRNHCKSMWPPFCWSSTPDEHRFVATTGPILALFSATGLPHLVDAAGFLTFHLQVKDLLSSWGMECRGCMEQTHIFV